MSIAYLKASRATWVRKERYRKRKHTQALRNYNDAAIKKWGDLLREARAKITERDREIAATNPLRLRAHAEAVKLIGIMERGGNNVGRDVEKIIRGGGGIRGQAWCGWTMAYVYKLAGSKAVTGAWGAVRLYVPLSGVKRTKYPQMGNLVRFTFDHIGMFEKDNGDGTITTIEGNTGASGAVSDSATGGDGVYRKVRSKSLVRDYLAILR